MTERKFITEGPGIPRWSSPISHAVVAGNHCYISGQLSIDMEGAYVPGSIQQEAERAFNNLLGVVQAAGFESSEIVFIDIVVMDLSEMPAVNAVFTKIFPGSGRPARTVCQAAGLPYGGKIKVTGIAIR